MKFNTLHVQIRDTNQINYKRIIMRIKRVNESKGGL
jgi:hypothetical protein